MANIILIGMPGCGKSTVGVILAKTLGIGFVDTDLIIQQRENRLLQNIIDTDGIERNVLDDFYKNAPTQFAECVSSYKFLKKNHYAENFDLKFFLERYKELKYENDNFFSWKMVAKDSIKANDIIKKYNDAYKTAPEIV